MLCLKLGYVLIIKSMVKKRKQTAQVDSDDSSMEVDAKVGRPKITLFGKDKDKRIQILKLKNA